MNKIDKLIKEAILSKDKISLNAYKNLKAEIQKVLTAKNAPDYSDDLLIQVCMKQAKILEDVIKQFSEASRDDLVADYTTELEVIKKLFLQPANDAEIYISLYNWCSKNYKIDSEGEIVIPKKEIGTAIKFLKSKFPTTDGKIISEIVKEYII